MAAFASTYGYGEYVAAEGHVFYRSKQYKADNSKVGVLWAHGGGSLANQIIASSSDPEYIPIIQTIADAGYPILSCDFGGAYNWGNDTAISRMNSAKTFLQGTLGAKAGKVWVAGASMGNMTVMNWVAANPTLCHGIIGFVPACDPEDIRANNRLGLAASINTAYGGSYVDATEKADHNPSYMATVAGGSKFAGIPYKCWYSGDDNVCLPGITTAMVSAMGSLASAVNVGNYQHLGAAIGAVDAKQVIEFMRTVNI